MECAKCNVPKISAEYPTLLSASCDHAPSVCLSCALAHMKMYQVLAFGAHCPEPGCVARLGEQDRMRMSEELLGLECPVFRDFEALKLREAEAAKKAAEGVGPVSGHVQVTMLDGQSCKVDLTQETSMLDLKLKVERQLGVRPEQQRLLYQGRELPAGPEARWKDAKVHFGNVLQLVVIMYETSGLGSAVSGSSGAVRRLRFDLRWTASVDCQHLNGSCIILNANFGMVDVVYFKRLSFEGIIHHGKSSMRRTYQQISVNLESLSFDCRYLVFTLSAYGATNGHFSNVTLDRFGSPSVRLVNADSEQVISSYTASQARSSCAVVLCCAKKDTTRGIWRVQGLGIGSNGSHRDYAPLIRTVSELGRSGKLY